ncbi:MAG TPA: YrdB family protein [Devosiaceae bacterium]
MRAALVWVNVGLRAIMEAAIVLGLGYWGWQAGGPGAVRWALAIIVPVIGFGIWGLVDFRQFGALAEPMRLVEELLISGLAALAVFSAGQMALGLALAGLSILHHGLVYALGQTLLKR